MKRHARVSEFTACYILLHINIYIYRVPNIVSTRGGFILDINKLEKIPKKCKKQQTKKAPAKQRATKKAKENNQKSTSKTKSNQESNKKAKRTATNQSTSKTQRVVWRGQVGLVLDKCLSWRRVKCRTFGRFFLVPGQMSHFWSLFFSGAGSEVALLVAVFSLFFRGRVKSRTFGSLLFRSFFALCLHVCEKYA